MRCSTRCLLDTPAHDFFFGTFFPFLRALDRPMAIACLRLFTFPPFPPRPLLAVPRLYRRISLSTSRPALREYRRFAVLGMTALLIVHFRAALLRARRSDVLRRASNVHARDHTSQDLLAPRLRAAPTQGGSKPFEHAVLECRHD